MSGYLQRLLDRTAPAAPTSGTAVGDTPVARPAMPSRSPIAAADQRLHDPNLAALIGPVPPVQAAEAGLFGPEPDAGSNADGRPSAQATGYVERSMRRAAEARDRNSGRTPSTSAPMHIREEPPPPTEAQPGTPESPAFGERREAAAEPAEPQPVAPLPAEHPLRRLDFDFMRPPAETPPISEPPPLASRKIDPVAERPPARDLRHLDDPDTVMPDAAAPQPASPPPIARTETFAAETLHDPTETALPQTAEPPPLPAPPPPPAPEPDTIVIEKTETASQTARTEQPKPEAAPPEPVERPRPRPKTAADASLIGPLPQRMRIRTLFGVRRR